MFGKEVFRFAGRGSKRLELRQLVPANRKATAEVIGEQCAALVNLGRGPNFVVSAPRVGWRRFAASGTVGRRVNGEQGQENTKDRLVSGSVFGKVINS